MIKKYKFKIRPCKKNIGAKIICNLKLVNKKQIKLIKNSLNKYGMVFFRNQNLDSRSYILFAKKFGHVADYPMLRGLSSKFPEITVVERKVSDRGPSFGEQFHTDSSYTKKPPKFTILLAKLVPPRGLGNTEFASQYLAYKNLPKIYKKKFENLKAVFSSSGPISITRLEREKEKGRMLDGEHPCSFPFKYKKKMKNGKFALMSSNECVENNNELLPNGTSVVPVSTSIIE